MNKEQVSFLAMLTEKLQKIKKTDWLAMALAGAILLIITLPSENNSQKQTFGTESYMTETQRNNDVNVAGNVAQSEWDRKNLAKEYVTMLEERLEKVLVQMEGVGAVEVMITISDYGEYMVEKDVSERESSVIETENGNANRTSLETETKEQTIQIEDENGTYPYVEKEILPTIEGIVVVAEGGGNAMVVSNISKTAMALFPIDAHKIIVVKMSAKGD